MVTIKNCSDCALKNLKFVGKGSHGKVYRINANQCLKIFKKKEVREREAAALMMALGNRYFPRILEYGDKCIVREYIDGVPLDKYLEANPLTMELSEKLIDLYDAFKDVGYRRWDAVLFHIFVTNDGMLKMIDPANSLKITTVYPKRLLSGLKKLGCKKTFLRHVKTIRPQLFKLWTQMRQECRSCTVLFDSLLYDGAPCPKALSRRPGGSKNLG